MVRSEKLVDRAAVVRSAAWLLVFSIVGLSSASAQESDDWTALFNGTDLTGWQQVTGKAEYSVEGDSIVGTYAAGTPNSFLATTSEFSDFILEYEAKIDTGLNSGVQIRSELTDQNFVRGYQVEIDATPRRFTGGIYDERRRGWLYPLSRNEKGRSAFRNGDWNHFRVEAVGESFRVWVNGVQTSDLIDAVTAEGFIALQVHSIRDDAFVGKTVRWRNLRIMTDNLENHRTSRDPEITEISYLQNTLTKHEVRQGWRLLWDGESSSGWVGARHDRFPESGWTMDNGELTIHRTTAGSSSRPGDIVTEDSFRNFELEFEFRLTDGANSGVKYFVDRGQDAGQGFAIGCEFQLLDDQRHPDAREGVAGNRTLGSLYDLITADNLSVPGRAKQFKGTGRWNHGRIVSTDGKVEHWLNHERTVEFDRHSQMFRSLVAKSKYDVWPAFCQGPEGKILLQDHGDTVSFRNIKVREQ